MAWDDSKDPEDLIRSSEWNTMVSDQKGRVVGTSISEVIADTSGNLPAAGTSGRIFFETDTGRTLYDNGTSWVEVGLSESQISFSSIQDTVHDNTQHSETYVTTAEDVTSFDGSSGASGQFLQTDGTNLSFADVPDEVVIQDTEPSNPFEGLWWYDTGSSTMQYYDGTSFVTPGNTIDGSSITENADGEIQVSPDVRGAGWEFIDSFNTSGDADVTISGGYNIYRFIGVGTVTGSQGRVNVRINNVTTSDYFVNQDYASTGSDSSMKVTSIHQDGSQIPFEFSIYSAPSNSEKQIKLSNHRNLNIFWGRLDTQGDQTLNSVQILSDLDGMDFEFEVYGR